MPKVKNQNNWGKVGGPILLALVGLAVLIVILLQGNNVALFNPKGFIAQEQMNLLLVTTGVMLIIGIPAIFLFYFVAWKYRESNSKAKRDYEAGHSKFLNVGIWLAPTIIMLVLASIMWPATHKLEPQKLIAANAEPLKIQVVAMRWKWLFIYPDQKIATVNYVQLPKDRPVTFELTSDGAPMSSFWIPNLGGMLYTMTGHNNQLNLLPDTIGEYPGSSAEINGAGFSGMKFVAHVTEPEEFDSWVSITNMSSHTLGADEYNRLLEPSKNNPVAYYAVVDNDLYAKVLMKYSGSHNHAKTEGEPAAEHQHEESEAHY